MSLEGDIEVVDSYINSIVGFILQDEWGRIKTALRNRGLLYKQEDIDFNKVNTCMVNGCEKDAIFFSSNGNFCMQHGS